MNLFCFTQDGSTESIYEPVRGPALKEGQCSPARTRHKHELGGSDPSISAEPPQSLTKLIRNNRRSCMSTSALENETLDIDFTCWISSDEKSDLYNEQKMQNNGPSLNGQAKGLSSERTQTLPAECGETTVDTAESMQTTGRLQKIQNLVQAKKGRLSDDGKVKSEAKRNECLTDLMRNNNAVLTCISLGRTEKKSHPATSSQDLVKEQARGHHEDAGEEGVWSPKSGNHLWRPFDCPQSWAPVYHTCQQTRHGMWTCGGNLPLPQSSDWDRFESLTRELDSKPSALLPPQERQNFEVLTLNTQRREMKSSSPSDRKRIKASPEKTALPAALRDRDRKAAGYGRTHPKGQKQCRNSLESLHSDHSGQSSSSGVTSGSDCSSNRGSLRVDDDLSFTKQSCGRARVHTEYVPSPYDTESLKLKVGDVIDIMARPPMGIWTGVLNGRIGNFKFIYVDVLDSYETHIHEERHKSTVQEVLKRLSLEEYSSPLQLSGYQTVDDLMRLKERDLLELNVTDPEHRQQLLAAVRSLQQLCSDSRLENDSLRGPENCTKDIKTETNSCPRDSGCLITSESPDDCTEEAETPFLSEQPLPAS